MPRRDQIQDFYLQLVYTGGTKYFPAPDSIDITGGERGP